VDLTESNKLQRKERSGKSNRIAIYVIKAFPSFGQKKVREIVSFFVSVCVCVFISVCVLETVDIEDRDEP